MSPERMTVTPTWSCPFPKLEVAEDLTREGTFSLPFKHGHKNPADSTHVDNQQDFSHPRDERKDWLCPDPIQKPRYTGPEFHISFPTLPCTLTPSTLSNTKQLGFLRARVSMYDGEFYTTLAGCYQGVNQTQPRQCCECTL